MVFIICKYCTFGMTMYKLTQNVCLTDMKIKIRGSFAVSTAVYFIQFNTKQNTYYVCMYLFTIFYIQHELIQGIHTSKGI